MTGWSGRPLTEAEVLSLVPPEMTDDDVRALVYAMPDEVVTEMLRATDTPMPS